MSDVVRIGAGTTIAYGTTGQTTTYGTALAKVVSFTPAKTTVAKVPVDCFDNPTLNSLPVEDAIPGWISPGTWQFKLKSLGTIVATLNGLIGLNKAWKVTKSDGSGHKFEAYLSEIGDEIPLKESMETMVTLQINLGTVSTFLAVET